MFGYDQEEISGTSLSDILPEINQGNKSKAPNDLLSGGRGFIEANQEKVITAIKKDQTEFYVNIRLSDLESGGEKLSAAFIRDISIKESLELRSYKMVGEIQDYSIVFLDAQGDITDWNKGVERILGYQENELITKNYRLFFSDEDQGAFKPEMLLEKADVNGRAEYEGWLKRKNGDLFWASVVLTAIYDNRDKVLGYSKITRDLTERMQIEQMIRTQADELQEKNRELENFTYIASHDLQEPLSTVTSMIELIREEAEMQFNKDTELYFSFIDEAAERMRNLIKGLLNYSRLGRNRELSSVNLQELIDDVQSDLHNRIKSQNARIEIADPLPEIRGFSVEMRLLFQNIIGNALKFSSPHRRPIIRIRASEEDQHWKFAISDNGIGIKENYLSRIFVIFQRLNDKKLYEGDGIGLAHCKKIVEIHEGKIWAESVFGQGTTICFTISKNLKSFPEIANIPSAVLAK